MEDTKQVPGNGLSADQLEKIGGGGDCTPAQYITLITNLTQAYEGLIDFTSNVFDRVMTGIKS